MRMNDHRFWLCLAGTVLLAAGVIFLPRHISRSLDKNTWDQVEISKREDFSFLEQGSNELLDAFRAFRHLDAEGTELTLITEIREPDQISEELLNEVYIQAMSASEYGMIPWIGERYTEVTDAAVSGVYVESDDLLEIKWRSWTDDVRFARYYSLAYESEENPNKKELLNFWYLRFSNLVSFDYYFIVNAVNYQIYYAEIHNTFAHRLLDENDHVPDKEAISVELGGIFTEGCLQYYDFFEYDFVSQKDLYQKLCIAILYAEEHTTPIYIEESEADRKDPDMYRGICVGFQDLIRWVRTHMDEDDG